MATITISQNDYGYYITDTLLNSDGSAFNLTGYSVVFHVWHPSSPGTLIVNSNATVTSNANGTVQYAVANVDFPNSGKFMQEWEASQASVKQSFPTSGNIIIVSESP